MEFERSNVDLYFRVNSAMLWYGDSLFNSFVEAGPSLLRLALKAESGGSESGEFSNEEADRQFDFANLLAGRPVFAFIHSHPSGQIQSEAGTSAKGTLTIGGGGTTETYAEIAVVFRKDLFDGVSSTLINGS